MGTGNLGRLKGTDRGAAVMSRDENRWDIEVYHGIIFVFIFLVEFEFEYG